MINLRFALWIALTVFTVNVVQSPLQAAPLRAGAAKVEITDRDAGPVNDPLYVKALVVQSDTATAVIVTIDAVSIGMIGTIPNDFMEKIRGPLQQELGIAPTSLLVNTSHCHGKVCREIDARTVQCVKEAWARRVPVKVGVGTGREDRISENRRLKLKDGTTADVRHAYSLPADSEVAEVGPIDPEIGLLRLDRMDGSTLAVVYNFAVHPIQGVPSGANTADLTGFASQVVEDSFGSDTIALFLQGCGGDINPVLYKDIAHPRNAETLGSLLGISAMRGAKRIATAEAADLKIVSETIELPRADFAERIEKLAAEQERLVGALAGTSLNLKTFLSLNHEHAQAREFPSYYSHRYLHDRRIGRGDYESHDALNRQNLEAYFKNIQTMEELTRVQTNLRLLKMHQAQTVAAGKRTIDVELVGLKVGEFQIVTFPGELTVEIGLNLKKAMGRPNTFVAGYTNGYIYYAPTAAQLRNPGSAQEDCDTLLAPEWQEIFETKAVEILRGL
jgi:hypothetical protein